MDIPEQYTSLLGQAIQKRFSGFDIGFREISGYQSPKAIDWKYKGVECKANFYAEEGKLFFVMELEFPEISGLVDKIKAEGACGKNIESKSKFLTKPKREVHMQDRKTHYSARCRLKQNMANLNPQKHPDLAEDLIKDIWGYIMKTSIGLATGIIR